MKSLLPPVLALVAIFATTPLSNADTFILKYGHMLEPSQEGTHGSSAQMEVLNAQPKGLELPKAAGGAPVFCKWKTPMVKDGFIYIAFTKSGERPWHDRIVVDTNCDGKLSDETPVAPFLTQGRMDYSYYGPIEVKFPGQDEPVSYHATFSLAAGSPSQTIASVKSSCWYEGNLTFGGATYPVQLVDGNANGAFNDASTDLGNVDFIALSSDDSHHYRSVGKYLSIDGKLYNMKISQSGSGIELTPAEKVPMGKIRTKGLVTSIILAGENGEVPLTLAGNQAAAPAGKWMVKEWIYAGDARRGQTRASGGYGLGAKVTAEVAEGSETEINVGAAAARTADVVKAANPELFGESPPGGASGDTSPAQRPRGVKTKTIPAGNGARPATGAGSGSAGGDSK